MKAHILFGVIVAALLLVVAYGVDTKGVQAQGPELIGDSHRPFDPIELQRGRALPGARYPWQRVTRLAPMGWALMAASAGIDLDVTYINRTPMYNSYWVDYSEGMPVLHPGTENEKRWPSPGEEVTFTAHIVNKGTTTSPAFTYKWFIDGTEVASGIHSGLATGAEGMVTYRWVWAHTMDGERVVDDHTVRLTVDPNNVIKEAYEANNSLEDRTNALGFRIAITPEMYEAYNTPWDPAFSYSAEDWLQRQVAAMNWAFANSIYPPTPQGVTERVRINSIEITSTVRGSDGPINDGTSDGGWFVVTDYRTYSGDYDPATDVDWSLVHELSHQVGLIDLYNYYIPVANVKVLDQERLPANFGFDWPRPDLMGGGDIAPYADDHLYSSHSARGISSTKGYRRGYYGEYQFDIPQQNYLLVLDSRGDPAGDVQVTLYQRTGPPDSVDILDIDNTPELSGITGPDGRFSLPNRTARGGVTTRTGHTLRDNPFGIVDVVGGQNRFLLNLSKGNHEEFIWLDATAFNLAHWQGDTSSHIFTIASHVPPPGAPARPGAPWTRVEGEQATLCWNASSSAGVRGYYIYRAVPPTYTYERASGLVTGLCYTETYYGDGSDSSRVYAITAVDSGGRESGFSSFVWTPGIYIPQSLGISSDATTRVVLDTHNGRLLRQRSDGRYIQYIGSPHHNLAGSRFLAVAMLDRFIISHPDNFVRVADLDTSPVIQFGEHGSGPGQFETPTGVAVWDQLCNIIEGPHSTDAHTLLLSHFDGSYDGAQGEPGTFSGTVFAAGKYAQGVTIDSNDTLTYATDGNLNREQGAIEFWIRPNWDGGDGRSYIFFEVGNNWFNRMRIMKDGTNLLRFMLWDSTAEYGLAYNVAYWQAGEWHHVAATWKGSSIALFVDGQKRDSSNAVRTLDALAGTVYIGSSLWSDQQANAVIDEFRISDIPREGGNSDTCYYILVADSGNHRIQVFDAGGNFLNTYGGFGNGPGKFNDPQGVLVDGDGNVIVADSGNDRLQILSFDGTNFGVIRSVTANLDGPVGLAAYGSKRIIVADAGNNKVKVLNAEGNLLAEYDAPNDDYTGTFNQPCGVIADRTGNVVVADTGNKRVVTIKDALPVYAAFSASPLSGTAPLQVIFADHSLGKITDWLWSFGDGGSSRLANPLHTYAISGIYTVTLTVTGSGGSDTSARTDYIAVSEGELGNYNVYLPLILRR